MLRIPLILLFFTAWIDLLGQVAQLRPDSHPPIESRFTLSNSWKAGTARVVITPEEGLWMAGYASRTNPGAEKLHDLWAKALYLEDAEGNQGVLITADLVGVPKKISDNIRRQLNEQLDLNPSQIIINTSHTHSGPVLQNALFDIYPLDSAQMLRIKEYSQTLEKTIVELVEKAKRALQPAELYSKNGVARFQVNRRNNKEAEVDLQSELNGPNDFAVPVIKIIDLQGKLISIVFGYACHPTVLDINKWSGDYPGFAQIELEKSYPGVTALFFQGAGADQNPMPRRSIALARQFGKTLAASVERVLDEEMQLLEPKMTTGYSEVDLRIKPYSKSKLKKYVKNLSAYELRWAMRMMSKVNLGDELMTSYPYPMQLWQLGHQAIWCLAGETVVGYALGLKKMFGNDIFVMGYCNDVMSYIPTKKILKEGGYEGLIAQRVYGLPGPWDPSIESVIFKEAENLAKKQGLRVVSEK